MQVPTIEVDREEARKRVQDYTANRRLRLTEMDHALMKGYKALSEGLTLIDVNDAVAKGGVFGDTGLPKIALSRPDAERCYGHIERTYPGDRQPPQYGFDYRCWQDWDSSELMRRMRAEIEGQKVSPWEEAGRRNLRIVTPPGTIPEPPAEVRKTYKRLAATYETLVPEIPIQFRPNGDASNYLLLWEVKEWTPTAPADPLLLERIAHPVYVVVAQWDLTPLEQKLLEAFRGNGRG